VETAEIVQIEQAISAEQAKFFERSGTIPLSTWDAVVGLQPQAALERLSRVTERPSLPYRVILYEGRDPNAAALADGRVYVSTGMLAWLAPRPQAEDALAFVLAHELAHTTAQHLVDRYRAISQQNLWASVIGAGLAAATANAGETARQLGDLGSKAAALVRDVVVSGFTQDQELEADQLGIRYVLRAGYDPQAALGLLDDFQRFDNPLPFLRTHPYAVQRRAHLARYLAERSERLRQLRQAQPLYPRDSLSWQNLQRQIDALEK
jgi:predicted Zn-dependent protease